MTKYANKKICTRNRTHKYRELYCYIAVLRNCSTTPTRIQQHFNNIKKYSTTLTFGVAKERAPFRGPFSGDEASPSVELSA